MKKIFILIFMCLCSYAVMATSPLNFGIHGGVSSTKIKFKEIPTALKSKSNMGWMAGAFVRVNFGTLYLEPSLNYSHKTSEVTTTYNATEDIKVNSFDIPVMVGFHILDASIIKLRAYLGPVASFNGKIKVSDRLGDIDTDHVMWNGKVGAGIDVWKLTFDIDYEKSFKQLGDDIKAPRSFNFTLGLKII